MGALHAFVIKENVYANRIVAHVEGGVITQQQVEQEAILRNLRRFPNARAREKMQSEILNAMIEKEVVVKEFERMKGQIPESYIQKKFDAIQRKRFEGDPLKLEEALRYQGKTKAGYKNDLRREAIVECMYERRVTKPNTISPLEIKSYYDNHRSELAREKQFDIDQVTIPKENQAAIRAVKECLALDLSYDEKYQKLSHIAGVDVKRMNNLNEQDVLPQIIEKIEKIAINFFDGEPVDFGDQIAFLGLRGNREAHLFSLAEARGSIERILLNEKYQALRKNWVDGLRKNSYCVVL
jgi:hypothetical protein